MRSALYCISYQWKIKCKIPLSRSPKTESTIVDFYNQAFFFVRGEKINISQHLQNMQFFLFIYQLSLSLRRQFFVCLKESETYTRRQREEGWRRRDTYDETLVEIFVFICSSSAANENSKKWIVFTCIYKWLKTVFLHRSLL